MFAIGVWSLTSVKNLNLVIRIFCLIVFEFVKQRFSFLFSARRSCSPFVPIYGMSSQAVVVLSSVLDLTSSLCFDIKDLVILFG